MEVLSIPFQPNFKICVGLLNASIEIPCLPVLAIQQRRGKIALYLTEQQKFLENTAEAEQHVQRMRAVLWKEVNHVTPGKCSEIASECQVSYLLGVNKR